MTYIYSSSMERSCWNLPRPVQRVNELEVCRTPGLRVRVSNPIDGRACARSDEARGEVFTLHAFIFQVWP